MTPELDSFIAELRADPRVASHADAVEAAFTAMHDEGNESGEALELIDAIRWIVRQHVTLPEKVSAITECLSLKGKVRIKPRCRNGRIIIKKEFAKHGAQR
jgi:hypothetical protein